jgi:hypothetical protein
MADDTIKLEPVKAGNTILQMQGYLKDFNDTLYSVGLQIQDTSASTFSEPLLKALELSVKDLNNLGQGVNAGIYAFSQAFAHVVEQWKKSDAKDANMAWAISFEKPQFEGFRIFHHAPRMLHVSNKDMVKLIDYIATNNKTLKKYFDAMDKLMDESKNYWTGQSGLQTRQNWKRYLEPLMDNTYKTIDNVVTIMTQELNEFMKRDATNFIGRW